LPIRQDERMAGTLEQLLELLDLDQVDADRFEGRSPETSLQRVFGGQVAGQSLIAAGRTVPTDRRIHSLHAYFLRPGVPAVPIQYSVERVREGRSFNTRRVTASQGERVIFVMSANFQLPEDGFEHQDPMPEVAGPDQFTSVTDVGDPDSDHAVFQEWAAIDVRPIGAYPYGVVGGTAHPTHAQVWLRCSGTLPDDPLLHAAVATYASDMTLLGVTLAPHDVTSGNLVMASLDHAMWFHHPLRADDWLLYDQISPAASGGRGLAAGRLFARDGTLVATVMQEGVIRKT
jgi:acyl-CoA thioesterase-2